MNMFARFDENPAMNLQDIKETIRYGRTDGHTDARTDGQRANIYPPQTKFAGGIIIASLNDEITLSFTDTGKSCPH